jgi:hypothetical protein
MRPFAFLLVLTALFWSCEEAMKVKCDDGVFATVRDLSGLDGCGFVFELADGSRLEPRRLLYCGTPPLPKKVTDDPLYNFEFVDGNHVRIGFEEIPDAVSICMVGRVVKITCIEKINLTE